MVRHAIEDIKYTGGSTLTAQAVELSVQDLQRGRRPDAIQVVVLMNDGMSQDPWDKVLSASELLRSTGAERFGVALGDKVDLRELKHYIGDEKRIYRDGSTERTSTMDALENSISLSLQINLGGQWLYYSDYRCPPGNKHRLLLITKSSGSLPTTADGKRIKLSIISFADEPDLLVTFNDNQKRDAIFRKVEGIEPEHGKPKYAKALNFALE
ncbi:unnamed protein product [Anisakis simplex]|uniref:VWFA domain-containing protein n=1 Tax=Anisakis simplex TaxID=6269 RepID=A0A0M3KI88_ANISI|nr:unnamed protein product [Anisakis simplex]